jgi:hypothetical protein
MFGASSSAFWFYGRLSPAFDVPPFYAQEVVVTEGARIEIVFEHLGVWSAPGTLACKEPGEVNQLARLVIGAWALIAGRSLEWTMDGWIEATEAQLAGSIMGHRPAHFRDPGLAREDTPVSRRIRAAAELAVSLREVPGYRLALRDIHTALREDSGDALFFAYRALENVARVLAGSDGELGALDWARYHEALGRDPGAGKELLGPLTAARGAIGHGDQAAESIEAAERSELLLLARREIAAAIAADPRSGPDEVEVLADWRRTGEDHT